MMASTQGFFTVHTAGFTYNINHILSQMRPSFVHLTQSQFPNYSVEKSDGDLMEVNVKTKGTFKKVTLISGQARVQEKINNTKNFNFMLFVTMIKYCKILIQLNR